MKKILYALSILLSVSCNTSRDDIGTGIPTIDIEKELSNFKISKLSDYASFVRYVSLETDDICLVTNTIRNVFVEDNKIFVFDYDPFLKVFDAEDGSYLYNIGGRGQGSGELPYLNTVDINPFTKKIYLSWSSFINEFDFEGNYLRSITKPVLDEDEIESISHIITSLDENLFAAAIQHYGDQQKTMIVIFTDEQEVVARLPGYENPIFPNSTLTSYSPHDQGGNFYRSNNTVNFYRGHTDTVFTYNVKESSFLPIVSINYGKHRTNMIFYPDSENPNLIKIRSISGNKEFIFFHFDTYKASPEPFDDEIYRGDSFIQFVDYSIRGIYETTTGSFHFLNQPIPAIQGLENDLDGGVPLVVRNVSTDNKLIDFYQADKFLSNAHKMSSYSDSFAQLVSQINEDDNPIILIAE